MNLHYEIRICQKIYMRVTLTVYVKCVVQFNVHKTLVVLSNFQICNHFFQGGRLNLDACGFSTGLQNQKLATRAI